MSPAAGYTDAEKQRIATAHLVPHRRGQHGLSADELSFSPNAGQLLIGGYSLEPGVRRLDADIDALCRRASRLRAEGLPVPGEMGPETLAAWLGAPRFRGGELAARARRPGDALSLAATGDGGGEVLLVEAACLPGRGKLRVTGTVGPMMRESAEVAMTWVRSHAKRLCGAARLDDSTDVHVHLAEAAKLKDGPSAGVTLAVALVSALTGRVAALARALLAAGAPVDAPLRTDGEALGPRLLSTLSSQDRLRRLRRVGVTPLHIAAAVDAREVVAVLLEGGADPDVAEATTARPAHYAAAGHAGRAAAVFAAHGGRRRRGHREGRHAAARGGAA